MRQRLRRSPLTLALVVLALLAAPSARADDFWAWLKREVIDRIQLTGQRTLGYHDHTVEGDEEAFNLLANFGQGNKRFTDHGFLSVQGRNVAGMVNFQQQFETGAFRDPQQQRLTITYDKKPLAISLGDISGSLLNTNRFASFSKLLKGGMATYRSGRFQVRGLYSEARANARTISLQGNNSAGPYYLQASQIVRGSESVRVDGQDMELGRDYVINYELGSITFVDRLIPPTSTIVVTFEVLGFNAQKGTVQGAGMAYDLGKYGRIGLTALRQDVGGGSALSTRVERFQGSGAPSTPYYLEFEPMPGRPIVVRLDGIIQVEGVDYYFDSLNPSIFYFTRFIPLTSTIDVTYTPKPTRTLDGDRSTWGIDYRVPIGPGGRDGYVSYSQATGELESPINPLKGTARGVEAVYRKGPWELRGSARDVPDDYVSVETRGFNRNEDAVDLGLRYSAAPWQLALEHNNSSVSIRTVSSGGTIGFQRARATRLRGTVSFLKDYAQPWNLEYVRLRSRSGGFDTEVDTYGLYTSRTFGRLITRFELQNQAARGPVSGIGPTEVKDVHLNTARLDTSYTAGKQWAFGLRGSVSAIDVDGEKGQGKDVAATVNFEPNDKFAVNLSYALSDSGEIATLGSFNTGYGLGYNGNGFSGGTVGTGFATGATDAKLLQLTAQWRVSPRVNLFGQVVQSRYAGSVTSNSETLSSDFGVEWDLGRNHLLSLSWNQSNTKFVGSAQRAKASNYFVSLSGSPPGRWSYHLGANGLITGGTSEFSQDGVGFDGSLTYRINPRQRAIASFVTGRTTGYLGQEESLVSLSYQYDIVRNLALVASYKIREVRNLDPTVTSGAYKSRGFDLELVMTFTPR